MSVPVRDRTGCGTGMTENKKTPDALIGRRIRDTRLALGMSQAEFSSFLGISEVYLRYIENGRRRASLRVLNSLHEHLAVSYDRLLADGTSAADRVGESALRSLDTQAVRRMLSLILSRCSDEEIYLCYDAVLEVLRNSSRMKSRPGGTPETQPGPPSGTERIASDRELHNQKQR